MDKTEIYYFSGSGNSLAVARDIADRLNAKLTPVTSVMNRESVTSEAGVIGFAFPIYDFNRPRSFKTSYAGSRGLTQSTYSPFAPME